MYQDRDLDDRINPFHLDINELKKNKIVCDYVRKHYNNNGPILTKKKYDYIWYIFHMDTMNRLSYELYDILNKIVNEKK